MGRFTRDKGVGDLFQAFLRLKPAIPGSATADGGGLRGGGSAYREDRTAIQDHPDIELTGFVDDPSELYGRMDVLALPSLREGLPQVVLEAAAAGVPAVVARATGSVDAVVDGKTGVVVPAGDPARLSSALMDLLNAPAQRRAMGRAARVFAASKFRPESLWAKKAALYEKLLAQGRRPRWERVAKRGIDIALASALLAATAPLAAAAAAAIWLRMGTPVIFRQRSPDWKSGRSTC